MASYLSDYLGNLVLKAMFNATNLTAPTTVYLGLATGGGSSYELTGGSYTRQTATFTSVGTSTSVSNSNSITFSGLPTASVSHIQLWDDPTTGNFLYTATIDVSGTPTPYSVATGDSLTFAIGRFTIQFNGLT